MKNFSIILLIALIFSSCQKGGDALVGSWLVMGHSYNGEETYAGQGISTTTEFVGQYKNGTFRMIFSQDPNEVEFVRNYEEEIIRDNGGQLNTQTLNHTTDQIGAWDLNNDQLTISIDGDTITYTILEVSGNNFFMDYTDTKSSFDGGYTLTTTKSGRYELRR